MDEAAWVLYTVCALFGAQVILLFLIWRIGTTVAHDISFQCDQLAESLVTSRALFDVAVDLRSERLDK